MKIPFSVYDFFGYLASGLLICACVDFICSGNWLLWDSLPVVHAAFWITVGYIVGHVNAHLASWVLETQLIRKALGRPNLTLFGTVNVAAWLQRMFPGYFEQLDEDVRGRILEQSSAVGLSGAGEALFHHARTRAKKHPETWAKMETFLHLYGFCRNVSFALIIIAVLLVGSAFWTPTRSLPLAAASLVGGCGMLYRYLKFYRQYSYEMFTAYPDIPAGTV